MRPFINSWCLELCQRVRAKTVVALGAACHEQVQNIKCAYNRHQPNQKPPTAFVFVVHSANGNANRW